MEYSGGILVYEVLSIFIQITAMVLNGAIICTLWKKSLFRCPSNKFVFSLCLSQLLLSILSFLISVCQSFSSRTIARGGPFLQSLSPDDPQLLVTPIDPGDSVDYMGSGVTGYGRTSYILSHFQLYAAFMVAVGGSLTIGLISIDRYITISLPMKYKSIVTPGRTTLAISLCWLVSALITLLPPLLIFGNETFVHGPIAVPKGALGLYFAIVFSIVTTLVLSVMIRCYNRIFKIAKEKCQKVQIGHFTSPVSSISSDWPSSVYSSHHHLQERVRLSSESEANSPLHKGAFNGSPQRANANSLLQYVLLANLGKQVISDSENNGSREPFMLNYVDPDPEICRRQGSDSTKTVTLLTLPSSPKSLSSLKRNRTPIGPKLAASLLRQGTRTGLRKWRTFLQTNYNSPRKTVSTILTLIGSLTLTQFPITLALFSASIFPALFYFSFKILLGISAVSSPILYGFLNRTIRIYLWRFLRIRKRYSAKGCNFIGSKTFDSRKASVSSDSSQYFPQRHELSQVEIQEFPVSIPPFPEQAHARIDKEAIENDFQNFSDEELPGKSAHNCRGLEEGRGPECGMRAPLCSIVIEEDEGSSSSGLSSSFPRKPSQDSGADVSFSEDEEGDPGPAPDLSEVSTMRVRGSPRSPTAPSWGGGGVEVVLALALEKGLQYADEDAEEVDEDEYNGSEISSEPDDLYDFDEDDEEHFERMKDMIKKKFSLTEEDLQKVGHLDCEEDEEIQV